MPYYITKPFRDSRVEVHFSVPKEPYFVFEAIPSGEGILKIDSNDNLYCEPVYEPPPSKNLLEKELNLLRAQIKAQSDREDFIEDCIVEIAMQFYGS